jgi:hypothetical protein
LEEGPICLGLAQPAEIADIESLADGHGTPLVQVLFVTTARITKGISDGGRREVESNRTDR